MSSQPARSGAIYALACYLAWGVMPLYWRQLHGVPALEILAHRIVWSTLLLFTLVLSRRGTREELVETLFTPGRVRAFAASALLISLNWGIYVYAISSGQTLESSLGYFINPLLNVALGRVFFSEKLDRIRKLAVAFAAGGVSIMIAGTGFIPWIALSLALSFAFYGLIRKRNPADALVASTIESLILFPLAAAWLWALGSPEHDLRQIALLVLGGVITAFPLFWFVMAARRLGLSTLGFFQYIAPTIQFTIAVAVFKEAFPVEIARGFGLIWIGLALFVWALVRSRRTPALRI